MAGKLVKHL